MMEESAKLVSLGMPTQLALEVARQIADGASAPNLVRLGVPTQLAIELAWQIANGADVENLASLGMPTQLAVEVARQIGEGAADAISALFGEGDAGFYYDNRRGAMFTDTSATALATASEDLVRRVNDKSPSSANATQTSGDVRLVPQLALARPMASVAATKTGFFNVPDASGGTVGEGFTCTGLCPDGSGGLWVGNDGRSEAADASHEPSLVRVSMAGAKLDEIILPGTMGSIQGVTRDSTDGTLFFAAFTEGKVYHYTTAGVDLADGFTLSGVNGLTYDSGRDRLWVSVGNAVTRRTKAGVVEFSRSMPTGLISGIDHMHHDAVRDILWIAGDLSGSNVGIIMPYFIDRDYFGSPVISFADVTAPEGVIVDGYNVIYASDGYFHATTADIDKNQIQFYTVDIDAALSSVSQDSLSFNGILNVINSGVNPSAAGTMIFVGWADHIGLNTQALMGSDSSTSNTRCMFGIDASGRLVAGLGAQNFAVIVSASGDVRRQNLIAMLRWDGTTVKIDRKLGSGDWENVYSAAQSGTPNTTRPIAIGAYNNNSAAFGNYARGYFNAEVFINRALSDEEAATAAAYAAGKWT